MSGINASRVIAELLLAFSVIAFLASVRAIGNPVFRNKLLRDSGHLKQGNRVTLASAILSALWWAVLTVLLTITVLRVPSNHLKRYLGPMAGCLLLAWIIATYSGYRRRNRPE